MKITFVLPMYLDSPSGGFKVVYEYANRLQARGHQLTIVHPRNEGVQKGTTQYVKSHFWKYKLQLKHRPLIPWFNIHAGVRLMLISDLREHFIPDADAIIATAYNTAFHVNGYSSRKGQKFYLVQSYETWQGSEENVMASWMLPLHKIVTSRWLCDLALKFGEIERTKYIPIGLDFSHFKITRTISERQVPRVGMLAHPNEIKGTKDGLVALEIAKTHIQDLRAVLFGTHPRSTEIPDWIEYVQNPSPERLREIYNSCQVFLHPSWIEGWGLPAAEAMACGCALVATANEGVFEFAVDGENTMLSPIKQPQALAENLVKVISDNNLRVRLAMTGHQQIQKFTWNRAVDSLERLLTGQNWYTDLVEGY